jgi:hypothetical protein
MPGKRFWKDEWMARVHNVCSQSLSQGMDVWKVCGSESRGVRARQSVLSFSPGCSPPFVHSIHYAETNMQVGEA